MTAYTVGEDNTFAVVQRQEPIEPHVTGAYQILNLNNHTGLPTWLSIDERRGLRLAIATALRNKNVTQMLTNVTFNSSKMSHSLSL